MSGKARNRVKSRQVPGKAPQPREPEWRRRAINDFSYLHPVAKLLEDETTTIYQLFFELRPYCVKLHENEASWELQRIFDFADWCWRHSDSDGGDLSNAAGTAFYEHIVEEVPLQLIAQCVKPDLLAMLTNLSKVRMGLKGP